MPPPTVVIPVWNAPEAIARCLESVERTVPDPRRRILVIDDASDDPGVAAILARAAERPGFEVHRNPRNLGFAGTCNRGMALAGEDDVVLLNSDTVTAAGWLEGLVRCGRASTRIASVTPLTNNGTIASVPRFLEDNPLPAGFDVERMAGLVRRTSLRLYPAIPTAVGFCMWMARAAIREVGGFDDAAFVGGYGEENDWSLRAGKAGWSHRLDDATFVFHEGRRSFAALEGRRRARAVWMLARRHPGYGALIAAFIRANPLRAIHRNLRAHLDLAAAPAGGRPRPSVLHVTPWPFDPLARGGVQVHGAVLERELAGAVDFYVMYPAGADVRVERRLADGRQVGMAFPLAAADALTALLEVLAIDVVHVHGMAGFPPELVPALAARGAPWVVTVHDTSLTAGPLIDGAARVIAPSRAALEFVKHARPAGAPPPEVIPHGVPSAAARRATGPAPDGPLRLAVVGSRTREKGLHLAAALAEATSADPIVWHWLGGDPSSGRLPPGVRDLGSYRRDDYAASLARARIDVVVLASVVPETYSMTLSETWAAGLPVLATRVGALAERLAGGGGWTFDPHDAGQAASVLRRLAGDRAEVARRAAEAAAMPQPAEAEMAARYRRLYQDVMARRPRSAPSPTAGLTPADGTSEAAAAATSARAVYAALRRAAAAPWNARMQTSAADTARASWLARFHDLQRHPAYQTSPLRRLLPEPLRARLQPAIDRLLGRLRP